MESNQSIKKQQVDTSTRLKIVKDENTKLKNAKGHLNKDLIKLKKLNDDLKKLLEEEKAKVDDMQKKFEKEIIELKRDLLQSRNSGKSRRGSRNSNKNIDKKSSGSSKRVLLNPSSKSANRKRRATAQVGTLKKASKALKGRLSTSEDRNSLTLGKEISIAPLEPKTTINIEYGEKIEESKESSSSSSSTGRPFSKQLQMPCVERVQKGIQVEVLKDSNLHLKKCPRCNLLERRLTEFQNSENSRNKSKEVSIDDIKEKKTVETQTDAKKLKEESTSMHKEVMPFLRSYISSITSPQSEMSNFERVKLQKSKFKEKVKQIQQPEKSHSPKLDEHKGDLGWMSKPGEGLSKSIFIQTKDTFIENFSTRNQFKFHAMSMNKKLDKRKALDTDLIRKIQHRHNKTFYIKKDYGIFSKLRNHEQTNMLTESTQNDAFDEGNFIQYKGERKDTHSASQTSRKSDNQQNAMMTSRYQNKDSNFFAPKSRQKSSQRSNRY